MERGPVTFAALFVVLPLLLILSAVFLPGAAAYALTLAIVAILAFGFLFGIAFVDLD